MSAYQHMIRPTPVGMNSAIDISALPLEEAPLVRGFLPARHANLNLAHIPEPLQGVSIVNQQVLTTAFYRDRHRASIGETDSRDLLVVFYKPPNHTRVQVCRLRKTEIAGGYIVLTGVNHQYLTIPDYLAEKPLDPALGNWCPQIRWVQYNDELIFCSGNGSTPRRMWTDESGTAYCEALCTGRYDIDIAGFSAVWATVVPRSPATGMEQSDSGGAITYNYRIMLADEKHRMGDVSDTVERVSVPGSAYNAIDMTIPPEVTFGTFPRYAYVARASQGTGAYYLLQNNLTGLMYVDLLGLDGANKHFHDATNEALLTAGTAAPLPGDNTACSPCSIIAVHGDRLVLNDASYGAIEPGSPNPDYTDPASLCRLQISTVLEPTHFPVSVDPNNLASGSTLSIGHDIGDEVTGICSIGSFLGVWMRNAFWQLNGTSINDWSLYKVHNKGCVSQETIKVCENLVMYLADDGVYAMGMGEGLAAQCMSTKVSNYFTGPVLGATTIDGKTVEY